MEILLNIHNFQFCGYSFPPLTHSTFFLLLLHWKMDYKGLEKAGLGVLCLCTFGCWKQFKKEEIKLDEWNSFLLSISKPWVTNQTFSDWIRPVNTKGSYLVACSTVHYQVGIEFLLFKSTSLPPGVSHSINPICPIEVIVPAKIRRKMFEMCMEEQLNIVKWSLNVYFQHIRKFFKDCAKFRRRLKATRANTYCTRFPYRFAWQRLHCPCGENSLVPPIDLLGVLTALAQTLHNDFNAASGMGPQTKAFGPASICCCTGVLAALLFTSRKFPILSRSL